MGEILVGTCSWTDRALVGSGGYPAGRRSAEGRLRYYAERFPVVEVDASYYAAALGTEQPLMGGTDAGGLRVRRQGVLAAHRASHAQRGDAARAAAGRAGSAGAGRGVGAVRRGDRAVAAGRAAGLRAVPVPAVGAGGGAR